MEWTTVYGATDDVRIHIWPEDGFTHREGLHCPCNPDERHFYAGNNHTFSIRHALEHKEMPPDADLPDVREPGE